MVHPLEPHEPRAGDRAVERGDEAVARHAVAPLQISPRQLRGQRARSVVVTSEMAGTGLSGGWVARNARRAS
jgi:hypothetical protein